MAATVVTSTLSFLRDDPKYQHEKPFQIISGILPQFWESNCEFTSFSVPITDCRGFKSSFSLAENGFEFWDWDLHHDLRRVLSQRSSDDIAADKLVEPYLLETIAVVRERLKADKVICFDWRVSACFLAPEQLTQQPSGPFSSGPRDQRNLA
jgi:hypothetical protein